MSVTTTKKKKKKERRKEEKKKKKSGDAVFPRGTSRLSVFHQRGHLHAGAGGEEG